MTLGDTVSFSWQGGGSYANEVFAVNNVVSGATVYSSGIASLLTPGATQLSIYCNTAPPACSAPVGAAFTTGIYTAEGNWPGSLDAGEYYLVEYGTSGFH